MEQLPYSLKGFTKKHEDGYTIILNARWTMEVLQETYLHELEHIKAEHFDREDTINAELELRSV